MKTWSFILGIIGLMMVLLAAGCSKDGGGDCFRSTGEVKLETRTVAGFHLIEVHDNINLILAQDTTGYALQVEAGENLLDDITTEVENGHLVIRNGNTCNWVRSFEVPISVYIRFPSLDTIIFRAAGDLTFTTAWRSDSIQMDVWEGAGTLSLDLDVFKSRIYVHYGVVDVVLKGTSQVNYISNKGYGPVDARQLSTKFTFLSTLSPNDCFVNVQSEIGATIENIGNVYYLGDPAVVSEVTYSTGRLIRLE